MATAYKILGQVHPAGTSNTDLYTVGSGKSAVVSSLTISNVTASASSARVWVRAGGSAAAHVYALIYDAAIAANSVNTFTLGITLSATDVLTVRSGTGADLTFMAFGSEIS